jgi:hypothetical protein
MRLLRAKPPGEAGLHTDDVTPGWPDAAPAIDPPSAQRLEETLAAAVQDVLRGTPAVIVAPVLQGLLPDGLPGVPAAPPEPASFDPGLVLTTVPGDGVGVAYGDTFRLHSNPGSTYKVYLDFDGHTTTNTQWNSYWGQSSFYSAAFSTDAAESFNATELTRVQQVWQRVAEYFAPFNIDVTTEDPGTAGLTRSGSGDNAFGIRVVVTDEARSGYGGIAWIGSFDWSTGEAAFVYANNLGPDSARYIADAAAHEAGHSLGLSHDGQTAGGTTAEYYYGHGSGATDWAPVMGAGYSANIVQWSRGQYLGATQTEDDLSIITTQNSGLGYAADAAGGTIATAAVLSGSTAGGLTTVATWGVISGSGASNDVDMFRLDVGAGGSVNLTIGSWTRVFVGGGETALYDQSGFTMLDVSASLFNAAGGLVATSNDAARLDATIAVSGLAAGSYYLAIDGVGVGDPLAATPTGYTEYGSLGQYMIRGTYTTGSAPAGSLQVDRAALSTTEAGGAASLRVFLANAGATTPDSVTVQIAGLDGTEGALPATSLVLTRAAGWSADLVLTGVNDRDDDADRAYSLDLSAGAFGAASVAVTNLDDDIATASAGARAGTYKKVPTASGATLAALGSDDAVTMTLTEGTTSGVSRLEWRWQFTGLAAGDQRIHLDAASANEAMRFEYSNNGTSWASLDGSGLARTAWNGDYTVAATGSELWIRVVDSVTSADTRRDQVSIDLLTLEHVAPAGGEAWFA